MTGLLIQKYLDLLKVVIIVFGCIYIIFVVVLFFIQSYLIYYPTHKISTTPQINGLSYEEIFFITKDGVKISAWYIPALKSGNTILFCHGNAGNIGDRLESIKIFYNLGLNTFIFDYRGYGKSEGKTTEYGTYLDAEAAWYYLVNKQKLTPQKIIIFGRSLGGAIASWLAKLHTPKALIIESSFTSIKDIASKLFPYIPVKILMRFDYNTCEYLKKVSCPVLIIHSRDDKLIPFNHGLKLFDIANDPKAVSYTHLTLPTN